MSRLVDVSQQTALYSTLVVASKECSVGEVRERSISQYQFDHEWQKERERLANMEAVFDPMTIQCLEKIGVGEGWNCLEVGSGVGSIVEWLSERVGSTGKVVGTDLQTKFLEAIDALNVEVCQHNILTDDLEQDAFDLVCARKVLEHLADPASVLQRMVTAARPGGYLLIEDADMASFRRVTTPNPDLFERVYTAFLETMKSGGFNPYLGVELANLLRGAGLADVQLRGWTGEWTAAEGNPTGAVYRLTFEKMRSRMTEAGAITNEEADQFLADIQSPDFHAITGIHFAPDIDQLVFLDKGHRSFIGARENHHFARTAQVLKC
jgi:SAM-dependent methyltransferase